MRTARIAATLMFKASHISSVSGTITKSTGSANSMEASQPTVPCDLAPNSNPIVVETSAAATGHCKLIAARGATLPTATAIMSGR